MVLDGFGHGPLEVFGFYHDSSTVRLKISLIELLACHSFDTPAVSIEASDQCGTAQMIATNRWGVHARLLVEAQRLDPRRQAEAVETRAGFAGRASHHVVDQ
jgi:hypothetical protein